MTELEKIPRRTKSWEHVLQFVKDGKKQFAFNDFWEATRHTVYRMGNQTINVEAMRNDLKHFQSKMMLRRVGTSRASVYIIMSNTPYDISSNVSIAYKDALHIGRSILHWTSMADDSCVYNVRYFLHNRFRSQSNLTGADWLATIDYLRGRGYRLPFQKFDDDEEFKKYYDGHSK